MSRTTSAWTRLRSVYQSTIGATPVLTIGAVTNKAIIVGTPGQDLVTVFGGLGNQAQFTIQALGSDFTDPAKGTTATITGMPADIGTLTRQVLSSRRADGILYLELGNLSTSGNG